MAGTLAGIAHRGHDLRRGDGDRRQDVQAMTVSAPAIAAQGDGADSSVLFNAILHPNRSFGRRGFAILMTVLAAVSLTLGALFFLIGAWPVFGLYGLDLAILYWAFRVNYHDGRRYERVWLTADRLIVERCDPSGRQAIWTFQPNWLTVTIDDPPEHHSQLILSSHGRSLAVGGFLSPEERFDFANALRAALAGARQPGRFA